MRLLLFTLIKYILMFINSRAHEGSVERGAK